MRQLPRTELLPLFIQDESTEKWIIEENCASGDRGSDRGGPSGVDNVMGNGANRHFLSTIFLHSMLTILDPPRLAKSGNFRGMRHESLPTSTINFTEI